MPSYKGRSSGWMPWTAPTIESAPDPDLTRVFEPCLPGGRLAGPLLGFTSVTSTQAIGRTLAVAGAPEGTVVVADYQTAGRGRRGRAWAAPPGTALLFSCVLRPPLAPSRWPELTLMAGCALAEAVESGTGLAVRLKWPNDVIVAQRKVAGILTEGVLGRDPFVVLGIGVNILQRPEDWPSDLASRAVSLTALGCAVRREELLARILARLAARYDDLLSRGFGPLREAWRERGVFGQWVQGSGGGGAALDLAPNGALVVRRDDGTTTTIVSSDEPIAGASTWRRD